MVQRQGVIWAGIVGEWRAAGNYSVETAGTAGKKDGHAARRHEGAAVLITVVRGIRQLFM